MSRFSFYKSRKEPLEDLAEKAAFDKKAFEELYLRMSDAAYAYFYAKTSNKDLAEDMTQELFLHLYQKLSGYRKTDVPFRAWFFRVARNLYIDRMRREKESRVPLEDLTLKSTDSADAREDAIFLEEALRNLDELDRDIIELYFFHGLKNEEIAHALDMNPENVRVRKHRALKKLAKILGKKNV